MARTIRQFSDLLRHPTEVTRDIEEADVLLRRRERPNLVLSCEERLAHRDHAVWALTSVLRRLARDNPAGFDRALRDAFGWITFLSAERRKAFASEFISTLQGTVEVEVFETVTMLVNEWHAAAVAAVDPDLAKRMRSAIDAPSRRRQRGVAVPIGVMGVRARRFGQLGEFGRFDQ